jgi:hypothetical protein
MICVFLALGFGSDRGFKFFVLVQLGPSKPRPTAETS